MLNNENDIVCEIKQKISQALLPVFVEYIGDKKMAATALECRPILTKINDIAWQINYIKERGKPLIL